jgi:hypothetical protein
LKEDRTYHRRKTFLSRVLLLGLRSVIPIIIHIIIWPDDEQEEEM